MDSPITILFFVVIAVYSFVFHEIAHGLVAERLGDSTPRDSGRISLNPIVHIDPVMTILMPAILFIASGGSFVFGGAKAVPVNLFRFRNPSDAMMKIAIAGPLTNVLIALLLLLILRLGYDALNEHARTALLHGYFLNVLLFVFNMLPIPPMDGSRVLRRFLPYEMAEFFDRIEPFGFIIIIVLLNIPPFQMLLRIVYSFFLELFALPLFP